jgi:L,D-peptidoglycan transpeptidase YkuD (ErfK/YbiS/YcfS/YnhG family)
MGWCNDIDSKFYNKKIKIKKKVRYEKLFRNDYKYNYLIPIKYNWVNPKKNKGSAIFIHLTKNYNPTAGCIALSLKDFLILVKLIKKNTKIRII